MSISKHSKEYKARVVEESYRRENIKEHADELGIRAGLIYDWRAAARAKETSPSKSSKDHHSTSSSTSEEKRLRKLLKEKELEIEILKKAMHIFSRNGGNSING